MTERKKKIKSNRLAKNFHRTFIPEKQYLGAILRYAADDGVYDLHAISEATGLPTGESSGKAKPTADYCLGMGLITLQKINNESRLALTTLGRTILLEDRFFREPVTQWMAHLNLCNKDYGAETWFQLFWNSTNILGEEFSRDALIKWIGPILKLSDTKALSPTTRMYASEVSFSNCGAITETGNMLSRRKAPLDFIFATGYAAWITAGIERNKRSGEQVTVDELDAFCGFRSITGWTLAESQHALALMEQKDMISIDRHMRPWIVSNKNSSDVLWKRLYEDLI